MAFVRLLNIATARRSTTIGASAPTIISSHNLIFIEQKNKPCRIFFQETNERINVRLYRVARDVEKLHKRLSAVTRRETHE